MGYFTAGKGTCGHLKLGTIISISWMRDYCLVCELPLSVLLIGNQTFVHGKHVQKTESQDQENLFV